MPQITTWINPASAVAKQTHRILLQNESEIKKDSLLKQNCFITTKKFQKSSKLQFVKKYL